MIRLDENELARPPEEGARLVALRLIEAAAAALERIGDPGDPEGLHDFRVNVRRLRTCLRAYRPNLGRRAVDRALRRLRRLGARTNRARDVEVELALLSALREDLAAAHRRAVDSLLRDLEARKARAYAGVIEGVPKRFAKIRRDLAETLAAYRTWVQLEEATAPPSFARVCGEVVRRQSRAVRDRLACIRTVEDRRESHRARVQAKRLRYLLEPVAPHVEGGKRLIKSLKGLQDLLGELNDLDLVATHLGAELERASLRSAQALHRAVLDDDADQLLRARRRALENGLLAAARLVHDRRRKLFGELEAEWLHDHAAGFFAQVERMSSRLGEVPAQAPVEIERKFLLRALPDIVRHGEVLHVEQGWLPGHEVRERVRRVRGAEGERFFRTIKLGGGLVRTEFEDEISRALFEDLWPLTLGCRVAKRRYRVPAGALTWEIDDFLDRPLVLAEVELPTEDTEVELPGWLTPFLLREVTGDSDYSNLSLAR